jgi:hypothetical protein
VQAGIGIDAASRRDGSPQKQKGIVHHGRELHGRHRHTEGAEDLARGIEQRASGECIDRHDRARRRPRCVRKVGELTGPVSAAAEGGKQPPRAVVAADLVFLFVGYEKLIG